MTRDSLSRMTGRSDNDNAVQRTLNFPGQIDALVPIAKRSTLHFPGLFRLVTPNAPPTTVCLPSRRSRCALLVQVLDPPTCTGTFRTSAPAIQMKPEGSCWCVLISHRIRQLPLPHLSTHFGGVLCYTTFRQARQVAYQRIHNANSWWQEPWAPDFIDCSVHYSRCCSR